ncbi:unnamed protein product, partial [Didymodactylos carnosus]
MHRMGMRTRQSLLFGQFNSKYIRCDIATSFDTLTLLMFNLWNMKRPNLILSVTGGFDSALNIQFEKEFIESVTHVVLGSDAWIFTNGNKNEIGPRLVGETVYKNRLNLLRNQNSDEKNIYAIGVLNWANIKNRHELIQREKTQITERVLYRVSLHEQGKFVERKSLNSRQELEPNHTQFILFDD